MRFLRRSNRLFSQLRGDPINVIGFETSCDDTAVAIVSSERKVLFSERYTNRAIQRRKGGIDPSECAQQHNKQLPILLEKCLSSSDLKAEEIHAVAVTVTPGLVIALKEGISVATKLAKSLRVPLIPVHHMRAHALSVLLSENNVNFPFCTFLLSGGHALLAVARSVDDFQLYGKSVCGSPGECIDKIARELPLGEEFVGIHPGAAIEILAKRASPDGHLRYSSILPSTSGADMNFSQLKATYLNMIRKIRNESSFDINDFSASLQHSVARHFSTKLHSFFEWYLSEENVRNVENEGEKIANQLVISGGVASNSYFLNAIKKVANVYNIETFQVPPHLCTDNAEMIAYTGILMMKNRSPSIFAASDIPDSIYAHARTEIGVDERWRLPPKPLRRLAVSTIHGDLDLKFHNTRR